MSSIPLRLRIASNVGWARLAIAGVVVLITALLPVLFPGSYLIFLGMLTFVFIAMSYAWDILGGLTGLVSFGYAVYFGLGAYSAGIAMLNGISPYVGALIGAGIAALFSIVIGIPTFRLRGPYFAIATIGVNEAVRVIMLNWRSITGGASGLPLPSAGFSGPVLYRDALILAVAAIIVYYWIIHSPLGLALNAIREDQDAAAALGVNTLKYKLFAHAVGAFIVALAGSVIARWDVYIEPTSTFGFGRSIDILMMPVIGGSGTFFGPLVGGFIFSVVQDQIVSSYPNLHLLIYGLLLAIIMLFEPKGVVGLVRRFSHWLQRRTQSGRRRAPGLPDRLRRDAELRHPHNLPAETAPGVDTDGH
jgi:branched-chain amino acid transport system permease protein